MHIIIGERDALAFTFNIPRTSHAFSYMSKPRDKKGERKWSTSFEVDKKIIIIKKVNFVHLQKHPWPFWENSQGHVVLVYFILVDKI